MFFLWVFLLGLKFDFKRIKKQNGASIRLSEKCGMKLIQQEQFKLKQFSKTNAGNIPTRQNL
jgi:hypothetical protein